MVGDIPAGFDQWQWAEMPMINSSSAKAYFLQNPHEPNWDVLDDFYPFCEKNRLDFWLCTILEQDWTFFKGPDETWILSRMIQPKLNERKLAGPFFTLSKTEQNGKEVWVYISLQPFEALQDLMKFRYDQKIHSIQSIERPNDVWVFKEDLGRLVFTEYGKYVVLVHVL